MEFNINVKANSAADLEGASGVFKTVIFFLQ